MTDKEAQLQGAETILVVDDDRAACRLLGKILKTEGYGIHAAQGGEEALKFLKTQQPSLIISDIRMPGIDGYDVLARSRELYPSVPVILLTAFGDVDGAMEAIRKGAQDYLPKPYEISEVKGAVARALEQRRQMEKAQESSANQEPNGERFSTIVGRSTAMLEVYKMVARIAPSDVPVLITGESGTGKELVAKAIHAESDRRDKVFVAVNCAGLAEGLLESELFGHEKGAFTGAMAQRPGLFEQAKGGTLFLDEIGTIGARMQSQLLRVLQEEEVRRVGGNKTIKVDARILTATNRDLPQAVESGDFREDLYYRLNVVGVTLPPLRERREDIPLLVEHFIAKGEQPAITIAPEAMAALESYDWPGNVRELENTVHRALALCRGGIILPIDLPPLLKGRDGEPLPGTAPEHPGEDHGLISDRPTLEVLNQRYVQLILEESGGNKSKAAQHLGIDRKTLYRILAD